MTIRVERTERVELITLDRPERRNALDHATIVELLDVQARLAAAPHDDVRVVVLTGAAPAFCAGADLAGVEEGEFTADLGRMLRGFGSIGVPVMAAIDGPALGAGTQLVVACDLRVATPESLLGVPAAKLGLAVDHWTVRRIATEFSAPVARAMLVAAETSTAADLHRIGAIHRLGDLDAALEWAQRLTHLAPLTMQAHKVGLESDISGRDEAFEALRAAAWASADAEEGRTAFLEKRRPTFTGQ